MRRKSLSGGLVASIVMLAIACGTSPQIGVQGQALSLSAVGVDLNGSPYPSTGDREDWSTLYSGGGTAAQFKFVHDLGNDNIYTGGGSKDIYDITQWAWTTGSPPDKDDIADAFAAAYPSGGDLVIDFGLDLYAPNGDAMTGFWFFQNPVGPNAQGGFDGKHADDDTLVLANFVNGGYNAKVTVYRWKSGALVQVPVPDTTCAGGVACAVVNQKSEPSPWAYTPKSGSAGSFPKTTFFEGAINITKLVPGAGCFTGFLAETRSSQSTTAVLKDFAFGNFSLCSLQVTKTADRPCAQPGDTITYTTSITNTGAITLYRDQITDSLVDLGGAAVTTNTCETTLAAGATCQIVYTRQVAAGDPSSLPNTVTAVYRGKADLSGTAVSGTATATVSVVKPSYSVTDVCTTKDLAPGQDATFQVTFTNTGDAKLNFVTDECGSFSLDPGASNTSCTPTVPGVFALASGFINNAVNVTSVTLEDAACGSVAQTSATDSCTYQGLNPGFQVSKTCVAEPVPISGPAQFAITFSNTGDTDLVFHSAECGDVPLAAGAAPYVCQGSSTAVAAPSGGFTPGGTVTNVDQGTVTVDPRYQISDALYDVAYQTPVASCLVENPPSQGCSPGYWKNHTASWDEASDPVAAAAGFTTGTGFNAFFGLTAAQSGFEDTLTMLGAVNLLGNTNGQNLARQGVSGLLNIAAGLSYPFSDAAALTADIRNAFLTGTFEPLASQLAYDNSNLTCPLK